MIIKKIEVVTLSLRLRWRLDPSSIRCCDTMSALLKLKVAP